MRQLGILKPPLFSHLTSIFTPLVSLSSISYSSKLIFFFSLSFMAFSVFTPTLLLFLMRFCCFFNTWCLSTGSNLQPMTVPHQICTQGNEKHPHPCSHQHTEFFLITNTSPPKAHCHCSVVSLCPSLIMENLFSLLSTNSSATKTTIATNDGKQKMVCSQNSQFSCIHTPLSYFSTSSNSPIQSFHCPPEDNTPAKPIQSPPFLQAYPQGQAVQYSPSAFSLYPFLLSQNGIEIQKSWLLQPNELSVEQEKRVLDAYKTKVARNKRKLARQRSINKNSSSCSTSIHADTRRSTSNTQDNRSTISRDLYKFCTPDDKKLRVLLKKELKTSDVGSLGRIVLPKREAEENLPILSGKEGILVAIRDVYTKKEWSLKFKYWSNNKSRMYVLENTGDFVKQNRLEIGDSLTLYEDESKKLYFSITKVETPEAETSCKHYSTDQNYIYIPHTYQARDEEEASLALLIEQLKHKEHQEVNSLVTLSVDIAPSYRRKEEDKNYGPFNNLTSISIYPQSAAAAMAAIQPSSSTHSTVKVVDDHCIDDFYTGLDVLPDVHSYNFSV